MVLVCSAGVLGRARGQEPYGPQPFKPPSQQQSGRDEGSTTDPPPAVESAGVEGTVTVEAPFELTPVQADRIANLLGFWEQRSQLVKTYSCRFTRLEYDTIFGPADVPKTKAEGIIRYAAPDKGEFRVERTAEYHAPESEGGAPTWPMKKAGHSEHWICDGSSVFELNGKKKLLIEQRLPEDMKGVRIAEGPLPFMFGASKNQLLDRYWIRELNPPPGRQEYCLEAWPKRRGEAAEFQRVWVILDQESFLPNALQIFPPTYDARHNRSRTVYTFTDRRLNDSLHRVQDFIDDFISPKTPLGWKKVVENYADSTVPATASGAAPGPGRSAAAPRR
jgi:TIGR03009 family protein